MDVWNFMPSWAAPFKDFSLSAGDIERSKAAY
jgi:hypothetical protein